MAEIITFVIREAKKGKDGKIVGSEIIQPWKNVKDLRGYEWIRDAPSITRVELREMISATYVAIQDNIPVFLPGYEAPYAHYSVSVFQDDRDGKIYDVAKRLVDSKKVKVGDSVSLHLLGCCNIMNVVKKKRDKNLEDQGGVIE